jgi:hypothetical protein
MSTTLQKSIEALLSNAFGDTNSSITCRNVLLSACDPARYKADVGDLLYLDSTKKHAALEVISYRVLEQDSIERMIELKTAQRLRDTWCSDQERLSATDGALPQTPGYF